MNLIQLAIRQPITVAVGILLTMLAGYLATTRVPIEMTPEVQKGVISVQTAWPNGSPEEVEREVAQQQEDELRELSGLERMTSTSTAGQAQIRLELLTGTDIDEATAEVSRLVEQVPGYPPNVLQPVIEPTDPESQDYIAWFLIGYDGPAEGAGSYDIQELFDYVDNRIRPRLERIPGISQVNVLGGRQRELQIRVDPDRLAQRGITMSQLVTAIESANQDFSAGALDRDIREVTVRVPARWGTPAEAGNTVIRQGAGGAVYLSDVAEIEETYRERDSFIRSNGRPVLAMNFQREIGSNVLEVMANLKAAIVGVNEEDGPLVAFAQTNNLPGKFEMFQAYDQTVYVDQAIVMVRNNLLIGAALAIVVLLLFLRSVRSVGIVALAIPVSVIGAAVAMVALGRTVNVVSLAGAAFSVGLVVDNSIVTLENIYRHLEMGKEPPKAAYDGTKEVALAVLASTLTTVVVFVPVLLIEQLVGQLFRDIAVAICSSVIISYVVSILVIPSAAAIVLKKRERVTAADRRGNTDGQAGTNGEAARQTRWQWAKHALGRIFALPDYVAGLVHFVNGSWLLRIGVVAAALALVAVGVTFLLPPFDYLPKGNRNIVFGLVITPPGYNLEKFEDIADGIEANMRPYFEAGEQGLTSAEEADLPAVPVTDKTASVDEVQPPPLGRYFLVGRAGAMFHGAISADESRVVDLVPLFNHATRGIKDSFAAAFQFPIFRLGGSSGAAVKVDVVGDSLDEVTQAAGTLFGTFGQSFGFQQLRPTPANFNLRGGELQIVPDDLRARDIDLTDQDVGRTVQANADGIILRDAYKYPDELGDIKIITRQAQQPDAINALYDTPRGHARRGDGAAVERRHVRRDPEPQRDPPGRRPAGGDDRGHAAGQHAAGHGDRRHQRGHRRFARVRGHRPRRERRRRRHRQRARRHPEDAPGRRHDPRHAHELGRAGARGRVPLDVRPVPELELPAGHHGHRAAGDLRRVPRALAGQPVEWQRPLPAHDQPRRAGDAGLHHPHRHGRQQRNPDRRAGRQLPAHDARGARRVVRRLPRREDRRRHRPAAGHHRGHPQPRAADLHVHAHQRRRHVAAGPGARPRQRALPRPGRGRRRRAGRQHRLHPPRLPGPAQHRHGPQEQGWCPPRQRPGSRPDCRHRHGQPSPPGGAGVSNRSRFALAAGLSPRFVSTVAGRAGQAPRLPGLAAALLLGGCAVGPDYAPPAVVAPDAWGGVLGDSAASATDVDLSTWWRALDDPTLDRLVDVALASNLDLTAAAARVVENRYLRAATAGERLPQFNASADYLRTRQSETLGGGASGFATGGADAGTTPDPVDGGGTVTDTGGSAGGGGAGFSNESDLFQFGTAVSWELDVFGRIGRRVEAADRDLEASVEDFRDVLVTLVADVGIAYIDAREFQTRVAIAVANAEQQRRALELAEARFENGLTVELDVAEARSILQTTLATIPDLRQDYQAALNRLSVLLGAAPGAVDALLAEAAPVPPAPDDLAVGIPADLLRRRPDIRRAERQLAAETARVGAAEADLYPRFSLAGSFGFASDDFGELFGWDSRTFSVGPSVTWPIWQGGTLRALVNAQDARQQQALVAYEQAVLIALREVANALTGVAQQRDRRTELAAGVDAAERAVALAEARYRQGLVEFDRVLTAQRTLLDVQDRFAQADAAVTANLITLYRALGGGWPAPV